MKNRHLFVLTAFLVLIGIGTFSAKLWYFDLPLKAEEVRQDWEVETRISFKGSGGPAKVAIQLPKFTGGFTIVDQGFVSEGYGLSTENVGGLRKAVMATRRAKGEQTLYYRFRLHGMRNKDSRSAAQPPVIKPSLSKVQTAAGKALTKIARQESSDTLTFAASIIKQLSEEPGSDNVAILLDKNTNQRRRAEVAANILALANIPARPVNGLELWGPQRSSPILSWLEIYADGAWHSHSMDAQNAKIPETYFSWWRGNEPLVMLEGGRNLKIEIAAAPAPVAAIKSVLGAAKAQDSTLLAISFFDLPLDIQQVYRVLLTVPLGVLFLVVLRNVIGVTTFGTFMPVLMALAFRETQLLWGIALFTIVVSIALTVRLYFEHLKLLVVPRLASVLIVVVIAMALLSLLSQKLGIERGLSIALFPMVILTMTVERMSVVWDERGAGESLKHGLGSLIVATLCYFVMSYGPIEHILFVFPELLLVLLALTLLLGRYTGFRLLEIKRFRELARENQS